MGCIPSLHVVPIPDASSSLLCQLPSSFYTWIIFVVFGKSSETSHLFLAIMENTWRNDRGRELFARHHRMAWGIRIRYPESVPIVAGEARLEKEEGETVIAINLLSGSIMLPRLLKTQNLITATRRNTSTYLEEKEILRESQQLFWEPLAINLWQVAIEKCSDMKIVFRNGSLLQDRQVYSYQARDFLCGPPACHDSDLKERWEKFLSGFQVYDFIPSQERWGYTPLCQTKQPDI